MPSLTDINSSSFWEQKQSLFGLLNYSVSSAEKRLAVITGGRDTISANSGYMLFDTLLNGALVERMRITSAGRVGIGTSTPGYTFDVNGDINCNGALRLNGAALSTAGNFWQAGSGGAIYYNGGAVGIGTANPATLFQVKLGTNQDIAFRVVGGNPQILSTNDAGNTYSPLDLSGLPLLLNPTSGGSVAIGTGAATPWGGFQVLSPTTTPSLVHQTNANVVIGSGSWMELAINITSPPGVSFQTRNNTADGATYPICLNPLGGNVGIGTTSPWAPLVVSGVATSPSLTHQTAANFVITNLGQALQELAIHLVSGGAYPVVFQTRNATNDAFSWPICFNPLGGNVGIGTSNPQVLLDLPNYNTANSIARFGSIEANAIGLNNCYFSENLYYNIGTGWNYRNTGFGTQIWFHNGGFQFLTAPSGTGGAVATVTEQFQIGPAGLIKILNLPTTNPGAGTKQLWCDTTDGNRVKFAV